MALDGGVIQRLNDEMARIVREEQRWIAGERPDHPQGLSGARRAPTITPPDKPGPTRPHHGLYYKTVEGLINGGCYG
jgi:hypothetical protein